MKEQIFILENYKSFEPQHIFECGQCFRWNKEENSSYTGVFGNNVLNVKKENNKIIFRGICEENIIKTVINYFDLDTNYEKIKQELSLVDDNLRTSIQYGEGIRILKQDLWETIISFIISANNNIPRIKGIIERLSQKYGRELEANGKTYYTFPTPTELGKASIEDLRALGLGFRDERVYKTVQMVLNKQIALEELEKEENTDKLREKLLKIPGVGPKVADCIMLFSLKKFEVFPIDVWVRRVMNDLYIKKINETKVNNKEIRTTGKTKI